MPSNLRYPWARQLVQSSYIDVFGAVLILGVCITRDFHGTIYHQGEVQFGISILELGSYMKEGAFPLGIFSIIGAIFSVLATRLVGKQNNWGNFIAILTTISSGAIDYMFGNHSAIITYPVTFIIHNFAFTNWRKGTKIKKRDVWYYLIFAGGIALGFALVYLGAYLFGGRTDAYFLSLVSVIFGLSLGANFCNALKYEETFGNWIVYNVVQLAKNLTQRNIANVVKYVFYLFNAAVTLVDWKFNGDTEENQEIKAEEHLVNG
ncbi:MAG: nicotinamide mononucleotide transporter family protein [Bacteroidota bacterium]